MSTPITFTSTSARFELPMLFAAQAQKEIFVNEALSKLDGLLHLTVEGEADIPPASPNDGEAWIIGSAPTGDWANHVGEIAMRQSGNWLFATPRNGMIAFDKTAGQLARYDSVWLRASNVPAPNNGSTVDTQARDAIDGILTALVSAGILSAA